MVITITWAGIAAAAAAVSAIAAANNKNNWTSQPSQTINQTASGGQKMNCIPPIIIESPFPPIIY